MPRPRSWPIRLRLTLAFVAGVALVLTSLSWFVYVRTSNNLLEAIDAGLRSRAEVLVADVRRNGPALPNIQPTLLESDEAFAQITDDSGRLLASSRIVAANPLVDRTTLSSLSRPAMIDERVSGIDNVTRVLATPVDVAGKRYVVLVGASLQDRRDEVLQLGATLAIAGVVLLVVLGLGGWRLVGAALLPVERMRRQTAAISAADPSARLSVSEGGDEIAMLGRTLNEMLDRIADAVARERQLIDRASHELRTPLAVQRMGLDIAATGPQTVEELAAAVRDASEENLHLSRLAEDLLVLSRSRGGTLLVHPQQVSLADVLSEAVHRNEPRVAAAGVQLESVCAADAIARLDATWLRQALDDLIDNAMRATPAGGRIDVRGEIEAGEIRIAVEDSGSGFAEGFLPRAFEPFTRSAIERDEPQGAGLGLAIVRAIAEAHGGTAIATNTGSGARVTIGLPDVGRSDAAHDATFEEPRTPEEAVDGLGFLITRQSEQGGASMPEHAEHQVEEPEGVGQERPMPRERLDAPEMKAKIAEAKERATAVEGGSGKTADDLLKLARERRRMDSRT
ncbi:MAG: ATP-binding protein [Actinomycetota bacterium]|nr:ATP-binding protein [Actinomycetota bacterium]